MAERDYGFIPFGSGHSSILASATLEDASNLGSFTLEGTDAATAVYAKYGVTLEENLQVRYIPSAAERAQLATEGHMRCEIETEFISESYIPAGGEEWMLGSSSAFSSKFATQKANASPFFVFRDTRSSGFSSRTRIKQETHGEFAEVIISWYGKTVDIYVDRFLVDTLLGLAITEADFIYTHLGAVFATPISGVKGYVGKNLHVSTKAIHHFVPYGMSHICLIGHSFCEGMDYQNERANPVVGDRNLSITKSNGNDSALSWLHSKLLNIGWRIPQRKIRNTGVGGVLINTIETGTATANTLNHLVASAGDFEVKGAQVGMTIINTDSTDTTLITAVNSGTDLTLAADIFPLGNENYSFISGFEGQIDVLLNEYCSHPDVCIMQMGTNDASAAIPGTWQADYQVHIDRLLDAGSGIIILINVITRNTDPAFRSAVYEARVDELNAIHAALVAANSECHLVDAFNIIGGHNGWLSSDVNLASPTHLNDTGYKKLVVGANGYNGVADVLIPLIHAS